MENPSSRIFADHGIPSYATPEQREERIDAAVAQILERFPPR